MIIDGVVLLIHIFSLALKQPYVSVWFMAERCLAIGCGRPQGPHPAVGVR